MTLLNARVFGRLFFYIILSSKMAKIKYADLEIPLLNEHLGYTFQPNLYGQSMFPASQSSRARYPKQNLAQQFNQRQVTEWRNMAAGTQAAWNNFAATYPQPSRVNPDLFLTGYQLFVKRNFYKNQSSPNGFTHMLYPDMEEIEPALLSFTLTNIADSLVLDYSFDIANGKNCVAFYLSNRQKQSKAYAGTRSRFMVELINNPTKIINFGSLYNAYAILDPRGFAPTGWHIPTRAEFLTLINNVGGISVSGQHLKSSSLLYWLTATGLNDFLFDARGTGSRHPTLGTFGGLRDQNRIWASDLFIPEYNYALQNQSSVNFSNQGAFRWKTGESVRYLKNDSILADCVGNDGTVYPAVQIGSQIWTNLYSIETKYQNGDSIPNVTDNAAWCALDSGAYCYYNNLKSNSFVSLPQTLDISEKYKSYFGLVPATGLFSMAKIIPYALSSGQFFPIETIVSDIL